MDCEDKNISANIQNKEEEKVLEIQEEQKKSDLGIPEEWPIDAHYMRVYM